MENKKWNEKIKWRKILYEKQPFPDNYSGGEEFLKELRKNGCCFAHILLASLLPYFFKCSIILILLTLFYLY